MFVKPKNNIKMKTMIFLKRVLIFTVIAGTTTFVSCKKKEITTPAVTNTTTTDVASLAVGNYLGSGEDAAGNTFVNKIVKVSKVSDTRVKVEAVGHTSITTFEVNVMGLPTGPTSTTSETTDFAVRTDTNPHSIAFDCNGGQTFGGTLQ